MMVSRLPAPCAVHFRPYSAASRCTAAPSCFPIRSGSPCGKKTKRHTHKHTARCKGAPHTLVFVRVQADKNMTP